MLGAGGAGVGAFGFPLLVTRYSLLVTRTRFPLLNDLGYDAGADGAAALADREAETLVHRDRRDQLDRHLNVVARHHHLHALWKLYRARYVSGSEVELRTINLE